MAGNAASYVLMAPPEHRDEATASVAEGFRDACIEYGIPIEPGDLAYYVTVVAAKVASLTKPRLSVRSGGPIDAISA